MTNPVGRNPNASGNVPIILASICAALAAFFGSASAVAPAGDPDFAAGYTVGTGLGLGIVVALVAYFLALRKLDKSHKRLGWIAMLVGMILGAAGGSIV